MKYWKLDSIKYIITYGYDIYVFGTEANNKRKIMDKLIELNN